MSKHINNHKIVGKIYDLQLNAEGSKAFILSKRNNPNDTPIILGQFILLIDTLNSDRGYLCVAEEQKPEIPHNLNIKDALRQSEENDEPIDSFYQKELVFLSYRARILGSYQEKGKNVEYFSNVRATPSIHNLVAAIPSPEFMSSLFSKAIEEHDNQVESVIFEIGHLRYGTNPNDNPYKVGTNMEVPVKFNASNMPRKRTGIFGKSGYGKSNTVKTCIGMIASNIPQCGQLIFDTNGEYALDNDQNDGFMNIFHSAGMKNKVALYTGRTLKTSILEKFKGSIKPLKFDVFLNIKPAMEIVEAHLQNPEKPPLYLDSWISSINSEEDEAKLFIDTRNIPLVRSFYYCALLRAGIQPSKDEDPQHHLQLSKKYIDEKVTEYIKKTKNETDLEKKYSIEDLEENIDSWLQKNIPAFRSKSGKNEYFTNNIRAMASYASWWVKNELDEDSSLKGFTEILSNYRRFFLLNTFHNKSRNEDLNNFDRSLGEEVFADLQKGKIVIIDLASTPLKVSKALAKHIASYLLARSSSMFGNQAESSNFKDFDVLVYIEEAQNYLSKEEISKGNSIYERLAKEGRKFHLGLVFITQQPSAIDPSITSQTENIIAMHLSNDIDCRILNNIKDKFDLLTCKFLKDEAAKGLAYLVADPHQPFVLPCQIKPFNKELILKKK